MKMWQMNPSPKLPNDLGATVCAVEAGDAVMLGYVAAGTYETTEDCVLITFTAGPRQFDNNIEIAIPESQWDAFVGAINRGRGRRTTFGASGKHAVPTG